MKAEHKNIDQKNPKELKQQTDQAPKKGTDQFNGNSVNGKGNVNTETRTFNKDRK